MANIYLKIEIKQRELISRILIAMHCAIKKIQFILEIYRIICLKINYAQVCSWIKISRTHQKYPNSKN